MHTALELADFSSHSPSIDFFFQKLMNGMGLKILLECDPSISIG